MSEHVLLPHERFAWAVRHVLAEMGVSDAANTPLYTDNARAWMVLEHDGRHFTLIIEENTHP
jgi:hypothetical protein